MVHPLSTTRPSVETKNTVAGALEHPTAASNFVSS
jgi:hypothetical protein